MIEFSLRFARPLCCRSATNIRSAGIPRGTAVRAVACAAVEDKCDTGGGAEAIERSGALTARITTARAAMSGARPGWEEERAETTRRVEHAPCRISRRRAPPRPSDPDGPRGIPARRRRAVEASSRSGSRRAADELSKRALALVPGAPPGTSRSELFVLPARRPVARYFCITITTTPMTTIAAIDARTIFVQESGALPASLPVTPFATTWKLFAPYL